MLGLLILPIYSSVAFLGFIFGGWISVRHWVILRESLSLTLRSADIYGTNANEVLHGKVISLWSELSSSSALHCADMF